VLGALTRTSVLALPAVEQWSERRLRPGIGVDGTEILLPVPLIV
jgi:hypothetical protein